MSDSVEMRQRLARMRDDELWALERSKELGPGEAELVREELRVRGELLELGTEAAPVNVVVRDIDVPFWNLLLFMVKWVLASLPALIILLAVTIVTGGLIIGFLREFR